jgi:hypothetical protein
MTPEAGTPRRTGRRRRQVSRVVLTIEPESLGGGAIETAVQLARAYHAELLAVFVKTSDMINMASMPFGARVISRSGVTRAIDRSMLDHRLDHLAHQAEALLARTAHGVRWSFRTTTGHTEQVVAGEALRDDLLAICSRTARQVNDTVGALACSLLLLGDGVGNGQPIVALFEGDTGVLAAAQEMADTFGADLAVVLPSGADARARRSVLGWLARRGLTARLMQSPSDETPALARELSALGPGLLVMGRDGPMSRGVQLAYESSRRLVPLLLVS